MYHWIYTVADGVLSINVTDDIRSVLRRILRPGLWYIDHRSTCRHTIMEYCDSIIDKCLNMYDALMKPNSRYIIVTSTDYLMVLASLVHSTEMARCVAVQYGLEYDIDDALAIIYSAG